jgi:cellulose synthase/poly-beta-1,6-N-acetylglucosamine synthase-like glycosyltransferase
MIYIFEVILIFLTAFYLIVSFWLIYGIIKLKRQNKVTNETPKTPKVSIIIAARNEEENIQKCVESCVKQNYPQHQFEVIVVNDRSEDSTAAIVNNIAKEYKNLYLLNITNLPDDYKNSGKKHALKKGIEKASGEILLLTDADCFPRKNWIKSMIQYFCNDVGVVIGHSPYNGRGLINRLIQLDNLSIIAVGAGGIGGGYPILSVGRNFAYRRKVYEQIGGFEKIKDFSSGDDDLLLMLVRKHTDWKINFAFHPDSFVNTQPPKTTTDAIKQRMRWASKGLHYTIPMTLSLMFIFLYNMVLLITIPLFLLNVITSILPLISLIIKTAGDFIIIFQAARLLDETKLVKYFPLAVLIHIPYLVFFGLYGTFGNVQWKTN